MKKRAVVPGSFDPVTIGHYDLVKRCAEIFDEVIVAVSENSEKKTMFTFAERADRCKNAFLSLKNVKIACVNGLISDFARNNDAVIVKGARNASDFDYESMLAKINYELGGVQTLILPSSEGMSYVSSSFVRDLIKHNGDVQKYIP